MKQHPSTQFTLNDYPHRPREENTNPSDLQQVLVFVAELHRMTVAPAQHQ
jgi:hypothetical protein